MTKFLDLIAYIILSPVILGVFVFVILFYGLFAPMMWAMDRMGFIHELD